MEHRLVGVGITVPVLVQLRFPSGGGVGTGLGGGSAPGTLLGPEGSGFGLTFSDWASPGGGPARAGPPFGEPLANLCRAPWVWPVVGRRRVWGGRRP